LTAGEQMRGKPHSRKQGGPQYGQNFPSTYRGQSRRSKVHQERGPLPTNRGQKRLPVVSPQKGTSSTERMRDRSQRMENLEERHLYPEKKLYLDCLSKNRIGTQRAGGGADANISKSLGKELRNSRPTQAGMRRLRG